jgi:tRNA A37 threonylcarbamoyladenosine dehydratase
VVHAFSRTELAIGKEGLDALAGSTIAILGIGGVGSIAAEALARSGVGRILLIDKDVVDITNINRQLHALTTTVGQSKVQLMRERIQLINPSCEVVAMEMFYTELTYARLFEYPLDYVLDACDTVTYKIHVIEQCVTRSIPVISSMGAANKMDPTQFRVTDISKTHTDPLAKVVRRELRKRGIYKGVKVVFSAETPKKTRPEVVEQIVAPTANAAIRKAVQPPSSNAFVPPVAGLFMVGVVVQDLLHKNGIVV